jgi:hypothetical protein
MEVQVLVSEFGHTIWFAKASENNEQKKLMFNLRLFHEESNQQKNQKAIKTSTPICPPPAGEREMSTIQYAKF